MKCFKHIVLYLLVIVLPLSTGCTAHKSEEGDPSAREKVFVVGFSQLGSESSWRTYNTFSMRNAAHLLGIQLMYNDAEQKQENQIKAIRSYISYQADVIAFSPIVESGWNNVLNEARQAGIPVLLEDGFIDYDDSSLVAGYIGSDFWEEGRNAARFLLDKFDRTTKDLNVVEICGTRGSSAARGRAEGFREVMAAYPNFKIVYSESGDFLRSRGQEIMKTVLNRFDKIDVVFSHNDAMTLGAIKSIENADLKPGKDIVIISIDAEQEAIDKLKEGKINCLVESSPDIGAEVMELAKKLDEGKSIPRETYIKENVYTEWDDLSQLPNRPY